jgi:hypothetical protein
MTTIYDLIDAIRSQEKERGKTQVMQALRLRYFQAGDDSAKQEAIWDYLTEEEKDFIFKI